MSGRVHQIEDIFLSILRGEIQAHGLGFDGDAAFALDIHGIEHLFFHFTVGEAATLLDEAVGKCRFAVVNVSNDGKIADKALVNHCRDVSLRLNLAKRDM